MVRPIAAAALVTLLSLGATVATAHNAASCCISVADAGAARPCCKPASGPHVSRQARGCDTARLPSSTPVELVRADLPVAPAAAVPLPNARATCLEASCVGFVPVIERPPDRAPPTGTTVLLI